MTSKEQFDHRMAAIHGLGDFDNIARSTETVPEDIRHAELEAMVDVFLGENYDPAKRDQVEALQIQFHEQQADLYRRRLANELSDAEYVDTCNALINETMKQCEVVLGEKDFHKLFDGSPVELANLIDRDAFLASVSESQSDREAKESPSLRSMSARECE
jgi:hypothetical protein